MLTPTENTLAIITFVTGLLATCMLLLMIDEIFKVIDAKFKNFAEEKKSLVDELEILKKHNNELLIFKSENDELLEKNFRLLLTIDDLNTEINRIQPNEELLEENIKLVKNCERLHIKCDMLKQELILRDAKEELQKNRKYK
jgi:hypothetical protein